MFPYPTQPCFHIPLSHVSIPHSAMFPYPTQPCFHIPLSHVSIPHSAMFPYPTQPCFHIPLSHVSISHSAMFPYPTQPCFHAPLSHVSIPHSAMFPYPTQPCFHAPLFHLWKTSCNFKHNIKSTSHTRTSKVRQVTVHKGMHTTSQYRSSKELPTQVHSIWLHNTNCQLLGNSCVQLHQQRDKWLLLLLMQASLGPCVQDSVILTERAS